MDLYVKGITHKKQIPVSVSQDTTVMIWLT